LTGTSSFNSTILLCQRWHRSLSVFFVFAILIIAPAQSLAADSTADGEAHPTASAKSPQPGKPGRVLNGAAQHSQPFNSSVKLISPSSSPSRKAAPSQYAGRAQYPVQRLYYIPNAPVTPFRREQHESLKPRALLPVLPAPITPPESSAKPVAAVSPPSSGIMTWAPGYDSAIVTQAQPLEVGAAVHGVLRGDQALAARPLVSQFRSTPRLLTELLAPKEKRSVSWDEWYKRVCRTVYDQWLLDDTGPGKACIHVTAWSSRDIECKIVDFSPASGTLRDSVQESSFREAALRAVRSLDRCLVLEFPTQFLQTKVDFDLDISRAVDGPFGCQVIAAHGTENSRSLRP
jgi:hypothetical protein